MEQLENEANELLEESMMVIEQLTQGTVVSKDQIMLCDHMLDKIRHMMNKLEFMSTRNVEDEETFPLLPTSPPTPSPSSKKSFSKITKCSTGSRRNIFRRMKTKSLNYKYQ